MPRPASSVRPPAQSPWVIGALIFAVVSLVYANSLHAPFVFDDRGAIIENLTLRKLWSWPGALCPPTDGSTTTGRPFLNFTFAVNYAVSGLNVWSYHLTNGLIHAAAAFTVWNLARRTLVRFAAPRPEGIPIFIALLWAVHPLLTESVTCVAQRTESLCGLLLLLTLAAFERGASAPQAPWRYWCLSLTAALLGMATKEAMAAAPILVFLYDRTFLAGSFATAWRSRRVFYVLLGLTWGLLLALVITGGGTRGASAGLGLGISSWDYLLTQTQALVLYLKLALWPHPLVVDYGTPLYRSLAEVWLPGLAIVALLATTGWALVRRPVAGFFGAWFFVLLAPSSSVIPLVTQTMAEHRMYLPLLSAVVGIVLTAYHTSGRFAPVALSGLTLSFGGLTFARNQDYRSEVALWQATAKDFPSNPRAHANLGLALQRQGSPAQSLPHFQRALALDPRYVTALFGLGTSFLQLHRPGEAIEALQAAVTLAPRHADAQLALGNALVQTGRAEQALAPFARSLALQPAPDAHHNRAIALATLGRTADACVELEAALRLEPDFRPARDQLIRLLSAEAMKAAQAREFSKAETCFARLVTLDPANPAHHTNLGNVLLLQQRPREAIVQYEAALRVAPDDPRTRENLSFARQQADR